VNTHEFAMDRHDPATAVGTSGKFDRKTQGLTSNVSRKRRDVTYGNSTVLTARSRCNKEHAPRHSIHLHLLTRGKDIVP
jgi:hypothetical protein